VSSYIFLIVLIVVGYIMRRFYRMKEAHVEELPFDFESVTKFMVVNIITDDLRNNDHVSLVDLLYHAHRITFSGVNTYEFPWHL